MPDTLLSDEQLLLRVWETGHFWDPSKPNVGNVDRSNLLKLELDHPIAQEAIQSFQNADANFVAIALEAIKRLPEADGLVGVATRKLATLPRCPVPDFTPPPGIELGIDDPDIAAVAESMRLRAERIAEAGGTGSWPFEGCDPDRKGVHSIRVRIDPANMPATIRGYHVQALEAVVKCYAEIGLAVRYILDATSDCEIAKRFQGLAGGVIGWNEFPSPNTCDQTINGRLDTGYAPSNWQLWAGLEQHETGHGVGEEHTRGGPMNPSILLLPITWIGTPSFASLARSFGGKPIIAPEPPPPGPGPTPPGRKWRLEGVQRLRNLETGLIEAEWVSSPAFGG
jgi:hypothetical protein